MSSRRSRRRGIALFAAATVTLGIPEVSAAWHAQCTETWNPHGQKIPPAGRTTTPGTSPNGGQNPDGFYQVGAVEALASPERGPVWLLDGCGAGPSGHVYDGDRETPGVQPFSFGTTVKFVEANGKTPGQRNMATAKKGGEPYDGASDGVEWQLWGQGDLMVCDAAEPLDAFAHVSPRCVCCDVPPPPKDCELTDCAPTGAAGPLRLVFVVNEDYYTISATDLAYTAETASATLAAATGRSYVYGGATWGHHGATSAREIFRQYVFSHPQDPPDYVVVFTKDAAAVTYGGYALPSFGSVADEAAWQRASTPSYCNPAGSPYRAPGAIYGAVLDWGHLLGGCGYELQGLEQVHVSDVSFDGQCRNQPGLTCVFEYGEWQCPNLLADPEFAPLIADRRLFTASTINHELLHNFGEGAPPSFDHVCPAGTPADVVAQSAFNICGTTVVALRDAGQSCVAERP